MTSLESEISLECKKVCLLRCLHAVGLSTLMQFLLLDIFLLCINFQPLHPINWIINAISTIFSITTWLPIVPLLCAMLLYGIVLGKANLTMHRYYPSRFLWLMGTVSLKSLLFLSHIVLGLLTVWLYARFLNPEYRHLTIKRVNEDYLNSNYIFLLGAGFSTSVYHFWRTCIQSDPTVEFPILEMEKVVQIRYGLTTIIRATLYDMILPTIAYTFCYCLIGGGCSKCVADALSFNYDESQDRFFTICTDWRMIIYAWLLASQIVCIMKLMQYFFSICLTDDYQFPIEHSLLLNPMGSKPEIILAEALEMSTIPVIQDLAARDLYRIALETDKKRRQDIFALSIPGGHPKNWTKITEQVLFIIDSFTEQFAASLENIASIETRLEFNCDKQFSTREMAERLLLRKYNAAYGIRKLAPKSPIPSDISVTANGKNSTSKSKFDCYNVKLKHFLKETYQLLPGTDFIFGEPDDNKAAHLLQNSQTIVWLAQALASICAASFVEDRYGVVQTQLPQIMHSLLHLKLELDKLTNVNLNGKKVDPHFVALKNAVKRSLYNICSQYGEYLHEIITDYDDYRRLKCFANYQET